VTLLPTFYKKKFARAGERTRELLISFILSFHHFTAEPQRLLPLPTFVLELGSLTQSTSADFLQVDQIGRIFVN
jgi:hypothetical protein